MNIYKLVYDVKREEIDVKARNVKLGLSKIAKASEDVEAMKAATDILNEAIQKIGASVYEQEPPAGTAQPPAEGEATEDTPSKEDDPEVVDGEVNE